MKSGNGVDGLDSSEPSDFLARERAALGDDANLFSTPGDNTATVEDGDDDLLGGGGGDYQAAAPSGGEMGEFESSFPAIDTQNEVRLPTCSSHHPLSATDLLARL